MKALVGTPGTVIKMQSIHPSPAAPAGHPDVTGALAPLTPAGARANERIQVSDRTRLLELHVQLQEHRRRSVPQWPATTSTFSPDAGATCTRGRYLRTTESPGHMVQEVRVDGTSWTRNTPGSSMLRRDRNPCFYSEKDLATSANHTRSCTGPDPERRLLNDDVVQHPDPSHLKIKHQPWQHPN